MTISKLIQNIKVISISDLSESRDISDITNNSREVTSGSMFVAVKGFTVDGHQFIGSAVSNGASVIVLERNDEYPDEFFTNNNVVKIVVENSRKAFADLSCEFYEHPSRQLKLVGITGSNGKTTTAFYVKNLFETAGYKTGLLGTISNIVGDFIEDSQLTTPESNTINKFLRQMVNAGITHCAMEVSSHSLVLDRVRGLDFDYGVFTNITSDHLDFHSDFENYLDAKKIFFDNLKPEAVVIYNSDDKSYEKLLSDNTSTKYSFGKNIDADYLINDISYNMDGTSFKLKSSDEEFQFNTKLIGEFNAYNAASVAIIGVNEKYPNNLIIKGIDSTPQVPGRFEVICKDDKKVVVDYSHTADSLEKALGAIREIVNNTRPIYTVFGCGGNRDKTKRPIMGEIADRLSDEIYVTSDNPRSEDPFEIINEILTGIKRNNSKVIEDREEAIKQAICNSEDNAVILIAGKGHEEYQLINGVKHHFSDKEIAIKYLEAYK
ncbi:MAG: UDP-N-acetylmuramoyl-L-alanyl-D-glutamate--2,6-diaminopimelate ligase [Bacteroidetes bacterium]|nr:UDP-N-acetylmuramoyl-L-alanyl-D-glutamate--2,6-diaminopimelate ligase [Bacteroidota bacterium]MBU1116559.1 UDP-N-acetylmuramoyl-L-alanyl-D-glutamate--2,6-diaminopimelate ligase [Bacteroidota bacterium]MBU1797551.1 UDP-N-acetylmuramoyl-L-alanyl-D-glutamate--2,6-diaminopimelate ligase [Bacteroidota bacterium]